MKFILSIALIFLISCSEDSVEVTNSLSGGDVANMVAVANQMLFSDLRELIENVENDDIDDIYDGLNMSSAKEIYEAVLLIDSDNSDANFGLAFIELTDISQDDSFQSLIDEWTTCLENLGLDLDRSGLGADLNSKDVQAQANNFLITSGFSSSTPFSSNMFYSLDILDILNYIPVITSHNDILKLTRGNNSSCPEIDSIQDMLEDLFLNRLTEAITHLENVVDKNYVFVITGEMWDDADQDPIHIDDTEIYLMKGLLHSFRAIIYAVITYDVNVPYYDFVEDLPPTDYTYDFLNQNSSFLTIRPGKSQALSNAHDDLNNILTSIQKSWNFLQSDYAVGVDNVEYDIIQFAEVVKLEEEIHEEFNDIYTIDGLLTEVNTVLNENYLITLYIDTNCEWVYYGFGEEDVCDENEVEITISIKDFFTDPPSNLKQIIPSYNIETVSCEDEDHDDYYDNEYIEFTIQSSSIQEGSYYDFFGQCYFYEGDSNLSVGVNGSYDISYLVENAMQSICENIILNYDGDLEYFYMDFYFEGTGNSGELTISSYENYELHTTEPFVWGCPAITFTSYSSCGAWKEEFDVTIGGLFPNMTITKFFDEIIQLSEEDCEELLGGGTP